MNGFIKDLVTGEPRRALKAHAFGQFVDVSWLFCPRRVKLDHKRQSALVATRAVAQSDADKAGEALRVAEADLKRSHAAIAEAEGQIAVAEKNLLFRKEQLAFTKIISPYDGLVIRRERDPGDVLVPGASVMQIISLNEIWVSAWVDETAMPALAKDLPARIVFRPEPGRSYQGKVSRLGREMDRETREFLVDVRAMELPRNWTIGQRAEVFIETARQADAVLVPHAFLSWTAAQAGVFVNVGRNAQCVKSRSVCAARIMQPSRED